MAPTGGRRSGPIATAAPDCDRSMTRTAILLPLGRISRAIGLRGMKRPWRRSSGRLRMCRLASQVSWAASLSRLRALAEMVMAKPLSIVARDLALEPAEMIDIGDDPFARLADHRRHQRHAARRHVDHLAGKFAPVLQHIAAEQVDLDALKAPALFGQRQDFRFGQRQGHGSNAACRALWPASHDPMALSLTRR